MYNIVMVRNDSQQNASEKYFITSQPCSEHNDPCGHYRYIVANPVQNYLGKTHDPRIEILDTQACKSFFMEYIDTLTWLHGKVQPQGC